MVNGTLYEEKEGGKRGGEGRRRKEEERGEGRQRNI